MSEKTKWLIKVAAGVLIVSSVAGIFTMIHGAKARREEEAPKEPKADSISSPQPTLDHYDPELDIQPENEPAAMAPAEDASAFYEEEPNTSSATYGDVDGEYMTWDEINALSQEELRHFMKQITWDAEFQALVDADPEEHADEFYWEKMFLQMNEDYRIPLFGNPYAEVEPEAAGDMWSQWAKEAEGALFDSTPVSYIYDEQGHTITLGWEGETDGKGIYLVPSCSYADSEHKVAFYFVDDSNIEKSTDMPFATVDADFNQGHNNFIVANQTYNNLYASTYDKETDQWRLRWTDPTRYNGQATELDIIYGRAIDLNTGHLLATFRAEVRHDPAENRYYLAAIYNSEVSVLGELAESERVEAVQATIAYFKESDTASIVLPDEDWTAAEANAIVEKLPCTTYFYQLYDLEVQAQYSYEATYYIDDVFAVNIPVPGMGTVTAYFGPELAVLYSFEEPVGPLPTDYNLVMFGFDALNPATAGTILSVNGYVTGF